MMNDVTIKGLVDYAIVKLVISINDYNKGNPKDAEERIAEAIVELNHIAKRENFASVELDNIFKHCHDMVLEEL